MSISTGVQSVKADNQSSSQISQQMNEAIFEPFITENNNGTFFDLKANNVVNGYITDKTTTLSYKHNYPYGAFMGIYDDSNGNIVGFLDTMKDKSYLNAPLKAGNSYSVIHESGLGNTFFFKFKVAKASDHLEVPKINTVTDQDTTVTGKAAPGATVKLLVNGLNFSSVASSTGDFSINIEKKYPANTPISVYQELNGVKSDTVEVYVQLTADFIVNKIKSNANKITGSTHPNAQISIRIHDEDFSGTADGNGNFDINLQGATFAVGTEVTINSVSSEGTVTKTVQIYPRDPIIGLVFAGDDEIRGTVDPGATVTINVGGEIYQTTAGGNGNFRQSVNPNLIVSGATVTVSTKINGLESDPVSTTVNLNK